MGVTSIGGVNRKLYAFVAIMAWSRALFVCFATDMKLLTWLDCHRRAFEYFGGVPSEVLIDNLKTGVLSRAGGTVRWQPAYESMAVGYGFRPIVHFPMRPKTKGRVERIVRFVRQRFFDGRSSILDIDSLNGEAITWLKRRGNDRLHRVTREKPCDRFDVERRELRPLRDYDIVLESTRVVDSYGLVSVNGVRYSVPAEYARRPITLQLRPMSLAFLVDGNVIADHRNAPYGVRLVQLDSHLPSRQKSRHERFAQLGEAIVERYGMLGQRYVDLVEQKAPHAPLATLREVLDRHAEYGDSTVAGALESLLQFSVIKRGTLTTLCQRFGGPPKIDMGTSTRIPDVDVERRSLSFYDQVAA